MRIKFTADVITPDGSDTNVYGEPCEPGQGDTLTQGWYDPEWSRTEVFEHPEYVRTYKVKRKHLDTFLDEWLGARHTDNERTWYAADADEYTVPLGRGHEIAYVTIAAHRVKKRLDHVIHTSRLAGTVSCRNEHPRHRETCDLIHVVGAA